MVQYKKKTFQLTEKVASPATTTAAKTNLGLVRGPGWRPLGAKAITRRGPVFVVPYKRIPKHHITPMNYLMYFSTLLQIAS